jgi:hypothetical protein
MFRDNKRRKGWKVRVNDQQAILIFNFSISRIMKFKIFSLLFLLSLTGMAVAQTSKDLVGNWVAEVDEFGYECTIYFTMYADNSLEYSFVSDYGISTGEGGWTYEDGILYETWDHGRQGFCKIKWVNRDYFVLTILNNGDARYAGVKRHYHRLKST